MVVGARILVMGLSFKENCPDIRNTKIVDFIKALKEYDSLIDLNWLCATAITIASYKPCCSSLIGAKPYSCCTSVSSTQEFHALGKEKHVLYDLKYVLDKEDSNLRL
jgi:UDP-N-acetyl-D-galactosamine dehydrogenase